MRIPSGKTDVYLYFVAVDATDLKTRETGLTGFTVYRSRNGGAATAYTTPTVNEADATNMPGVYELLIDEDTTITAGADSEEVCVHITAAGMAPVTRTFELYRPIITSGQTITVANGCADADIERLQGSAIATPTVAGVLEVDVTHFNGSAGTFAAGRPEVNTSHIAGSAVSTSTAQIGVNVVNAGGTAWGSGAITAASIASNALTSAKIATDAIGAAQIAADAGTEIGTAVWATAARTLTAATNITSTGGTITVSTGAVTVGTNNDKTGYSLSAAGIQAIWDALTSALTTVGSIGKLLVDNINATISSRLASASYTAPLDAAGTRSAIGLASANLDTQLTAIDDFLDTEIAAIKAKTDNLPASPAAAGDAMTLTSAYDFAKGTVAMTESYAAQGATMTPVQALYQINQHLGESSISGTTKTVKRRNGSTTAKTFTLDSDTAPTSVTEAS